MDNRKLAGLLMQLGFQPNTKGFHCLRRVVQICSESPIPLSLSGEVYPRVAEEFDMSVWAVERAIRHTISTGWSRRDKSLAMEMFHSTLQSDDDVPSISLLTAVIIEYLR